MEQIYVENKKKNKKPKFMNVTIGLSFAVAFVAILSIVLISMSGSSYSLNAVDFPDKITTTESNYFYAGYENGVTNTAVEDNSAIFFNPYMVGKDSSNKKYDLLCLESKKRYDANNVEYTNTKELEDDAGFVYLSSKLQNDSKLNSAPQAAKAWIKQQATWAYFGQINPTDTDVNEEIYIGSGALNNLKAITCVVGYEPVTVSGETAREPLTTAEDCCKVGTTEDGKKCAFSSKGIFAEYGVDKWIEDAIKYHKNGWPALNVTVTKEKSEFTLTEDKKYYTSSPIAINISTDANGLAEALDSYTISLSSDAPKGTKIMAYDGKKLVDVTNEKTLSYAKYKSLRVYVPSSAETGTYNFNLAVTGTIQQYTGYRYTPTTTNNTLQKLITVDVVNKTATGEAEFSVQIVPDTATNLSKTIYIIGLIVLVSGLGILYVNVKKQKRFEQ